MTTFKAILVDEVRHMASQPWLITGECHAMHGAVHLQITMCLAHGSSAPEPKLFVSRLMVVFSLSVSVQLLFVFFYVCLESE